MKQPELGVYITTLRNKKGLTQKELAEQCNVDIRTIQRIENGDVLPRMYTVNLLSKVLDAEIDVTTDSGTEVDEKFIRQMRFSWVWGIIFSVNYIGVVYNIITHSSTLFSILGIIANIGCYVLFAKGFYHLGRKYNNPVLAIATLFGMVLIAFSNLFYLFPKLLVYYLAPNDLWPVLIIYSLPVYILLCVCSIFAGIGMFRQGNKIANPGHFNLFKIAGVIGIIQSLMFLTLNFEIQCVGLIISTFCNLLMIAILHNEYRGNEKPIEKTKSGLLLS